MPVMPTASESYTVAISAKMLITEALELLGVHDPGEDVSAGDLKSCLRSLNFMLDSWNTDSLSIYAHQSITYRLTGVQTVTIGPGGDIDTARPVRFDEINIKSGDFEWELQKYNVDQWARIVQKNFTAQFPRVYYPDAAFELTNINLWPIPLGSPLDLVLYVESQLAQITDVQTLYKMPPGYARALASNLAIEVAPKYQRTPPPALVADAAEAKANIRRVNIIVPTMCVDEALLDQGYANDFGFFGGGGSNNTVQIIIVTTNYILPEYDWLLVEAYGGATGITLTAPSAPRSGMKLTVQKMDADTDGSVIVAGVGPEMNFYLTNKNQTVTFIWDGSQWIKQSRD
jgi:hypothetical protein